MQKQDWSQSANKPEYFLNFINNSLAIFLIGILPGDLGMGKSSIEIYIQREALNMIELLRKLVGQPIDLNNSLNIAITNIIWAIVAGN